MPPTPTPAKGQKGQQQFRKERKNSILREDVAYITPSASPLKIHKEGEGEHEKRWLEDVKIAGFNSRNVPGGRKYNPNGSTEALYEGLNVNVDHPDSTKKTPRLFTDRFGWVEGVYKKPDGYYAKRLNYNPRHAITESFEWWATHAPNRVGLSQNAVGDVFESYDGSEYVHKLQKVNSIDLCADPATTKGLYEAMNWDAETRLEFLTRILHEAEQEPFKGPPAFDAKGEDIDYTSTVNKPKVDALGRKQTRRNPDGTVSQIYEAEGLDKGKTPPGDANNDGSDAPGPDKKNPTMLDPSSADLLGTVGPLLASDDPDDILDPTNDADNDGTMNAADPSPLGEMPGDADSSIAPEIEAAGAKIISDANMDIKEKLQKLKMLLTMHPNHAKLKEALFMPVQSLAEAKKLMTVAARKSAVARLIMEALDTLEVKDARSQRETRVNELITQAKLDPDLVTNYFRARLLECANDSEVLEAIDDRRKVAGHARRGQQNRPRSSGPTGDPETRPLHEAFTPPAGETAEDAAKTQAKNFAAFERFALTGVETQKF